MTELFSTTSDTFVIYLNFRNKYQILGTNIILMPLKNPAEQYNKVCCKRYYKYV